MTKSTEIFVYNLIAVIDNKYPCDVTVISETQHLQEGGQITYIHKDIRFWLPQVEISGRIAGYHDSLLVINTVQ